MKTITVHVTQADINKGLRMSATRCPVALAIARAVQDCDVWVGPSDVRIDGKTRGLSRRVTAWISRFDNHGRRTVKPFTFRLRLLR